MSTVEQPSETSAAVTEESRAEVIRLVCTVNRMVICQCICN